MFGLKDWAGQIFTDFGDRVFWNWEWNSTHYPGLDELIPELAKSGTYFLNYINPHFLNSETSELFVFGEKNGYFVKNKTTGETLLQNFGFDPYKGAFDQLFNPRGRKKFATQSGTSDRGG
jgi:alpha-glucosidase